MALNIFEVVRYEGEDTRNILAWRHPNKNMKPGTTLIVNPGQRAVFFSNGRAVESYEEGKHKIDGNNTQFLSGLKSFVSGGVSPDSSFLWFVNHVRFTIQLDGGHRHRYWLEIQKVKFLLS